MLRRASRLFRLGKERYYVGQDLEGNSFYERPGEDPTDWRQSKRSIEYVVARPLGDYQFHSMPAQWNGWLRRTRKDPPTIEELQKDFVRMQKLQENVERLKREYKVEKIRLAESNKNDLRLNRPSSAVGEQETATATATTGPTQLEMDAEARREQGEKEEVLGDKILAERSRMEAEKEREAAKKRKEQFAKEAAAMPRGNPSDSFQPNAWAPTAARRR